MTPHNTYMLPQIQPNDLQICLCWDDDIKSWVFGQWLSGPKHFVDAEVNWMDTVTGWRPLSKSDKGVEDNG